MILSEGVSRIDGLLCVSKNSLADIKIPAKADAKTGETSLLKGLAQ
jgi:hypothetical protein